MTADAGLRMDTDIKYYLLAVGVMVYGAGYLVLVAAVWLGHVEGITGIAALLMATGLLIAMVFGLLLARVVADVTGEL